MRLALFIALLLVFFAVVYRVGAGIKPDRSGEPWSALGRFWGNLGSYLKGPAVPDPEAEQYSLELLKKARAKCAVEGCRIRGPHSHTEALLKRIREK